VEGIDPDPGARPKHPAPLAAAQTDQRLAWVDPLAPAGNFAMITGTLAHLRLEQAIQHEPVELTDHDLDDIWQRWLRAFAGSR
jgi:hypothetical protein